jgi:hypothetical protein
MGTEDRSPVSRKRVSEGGFALGLVVLLLFAIGAMGAAGYQIIRMEAFQARQGLETVRALAVAQGGLQWFIGGQRGLVPDNATVNVNGGTAAITTRKVATLSPGEDLYYITSEGAFSDPRYPQIPAVRRVSQYAVLKNLPMKTLASLITTGVRVRVRMAAVIDGADHALAGQCPGAPASPWAGVIARSNIQTKAGGTILGSPPGLTLGSYQKVVEAVGVPWDVLTDSEFPVEYDGSWPNFTSLESASFPVIRVTGDFFPSAAESGQGVLIVTGDLGIPANSGWQWRGIVMAGGLRDFGPDALFTVEGILVAGQGSTMKHWDMDNGRILYNSCYASWAGAALAHLKAVSGAWWEEI